jgi:hypothetical protein
MRKLVTRAKQAALAWLMVAAPPAALLKLYLEKRRGFLLRDKELSQ